MAPYSLHPVTQAGCVVMTAMATRNRHTPNNRKHHNCSLPHFDTNGNDSMMNGDPNNKKHKASLNGSKHSTTVTNCIIHRLRSILRHPRHKKNAVLVVFVLFCIYSLKSVGQMLSPPAPALTIQREGITPQNITVVLMNHARPQNILKSSLLPTLLENKHITEVLLLHSNPPLAFDYQHPKVRNLNSTLENAKMGLSLRFWFCGVAATNDWVIFVDDDMLFPKTTLEEMIYEFAHNPHRIVGVIGRTLSLYYKTAPITQGYNTRKVEGPTEVVLTKLMIMERDICPYFHEFAHIMDDVIATSHPHWNGEDIFMSLVANHVYGNLNKYDKRTQELARQGQNNYAMPWLPVSDVEDKYKDDEERNGENDVSGNFSYFELRPWDLKWWQKLHKAFLHLWYRGGLWKKAKKRLKKQPVLEKNVVPVSKR